MLAQVDILVLEAASKAFDENVVHPVPLAVHANADACFLELIDPGGACVLASLIRIHDLGPASSHRSCFVQCGQAELRIQGV